MVDGLTLIDGAMRSKINQKFHKLNQNFNPGLDWQNTVLQEEEDLLLFLLTRPSLNDLQEFLQEKIVDWTIASETLKKSDLRYKLAKKRIKVFGLLIEFSDTFKGEK